MKRSNTVVLLFFFFIISADRKEAISEYNTALNYLKNHNKDAALTHFKKAYAFDPTHEEIMMHLASIHFFSKEYELALPYFEQYLTQKPHDNDIRFYYGMTYNRMGNFQEATKHFKQIHEQKHDELTRVALLKNYVRNKDWNKAGDVIDQQLWWYNDSIHGKTILLDCARNGNGIGDIIFFLRYAKNLNQAGAHVVAAIPTKLHPLCACCPYIDTIISPKDKDNITFDRSYNICIASLILRNQYTLHARRNDIPYITPPPSVIEKWRDILNDNNRLKVGLYWEGTPNQSTYLGKQLDNPRSVAFEHIKQLESIKGITFYSLQKDNSLPSHCFIQTFDDSFDEMDGAFIDTVGVMKNLDLVISIDGSLAHLAGAIGIPVWLLLSCESDYRWFNQTADTPWYPNMRIFRQSTYNDWQPVIDQIKQKLTQMVLLDS